MRYGTDQRDGFCPYLERDDPRCGRRLSLTRLNQAFAYCIEGCGSCPVYHELAAEDAEDRAESIDAAETTLTLEGRRAGLARMRAEGAGSTSRAFDRQRADGLNDSRESRLLQRPGPAPEPAYLGIRTAGR